MDSEKIRGVDGLPLVHVPTEVESLLVVEREEVVIEETSKIGNALPETIGRNDMPLPDIGRVPAGSKAREVLATTPRSLRWSGARLNKNWREFRRIR